MCSPRLLCAGDMGFGDKFGEPENQEGIIIAMESAAGKAFTGSAVLPRLVGGTAHCSLQPQFCHCSLSDLQDSFQKYQLAAPPQGIH